jgi:hypothetical protein
MMYAKETKFKKTNNFVESDIEGQVVMMSIENSKYFGMDEIGTQIWQLVDKNLTYNEIIESLLDEYEIDRDTCEKESTEFIDKLLKYKLIEMV